MSRLPDRSKESYGSAETGEDEEEEEIDELAYKTVKDAVLFAIDVSDSMLQPVASLNDDKSKDSATSVALKCAYSLMQQRIISNPKDMMGILLFGTKLSKFQEGTEKSKGGLQYPHCYLLADLDVPSAEDVKRIRGLIEDEEQAKKVLTPSDEPVTMANVLFCANQIFTTKAPNFSSRRLFLVTDNDNPHSRNKELKSAAVVRAKDLYDLGVVIELFPISRPGASFDRAKFYDDIVYRLNPSDPEAPAPMVMATKTLDGKDGISLLQSLLTSINSKAVPKRALFSNLPLEISPDLAISVKGYIIYKRQEPAKSCYIWLDGETPQLAVGSTARVIDEAARDIVKTEVRKGFKFGGETVTFSPEELSKVRHFGEPVIRIIGFKPLAMLPLWAKFRTATFMYPSEEGYLGSVRTFSALHQSLLKKEKMGIAWYIARKSASPVLAALIPGAEKLGPANEQVQPPGIWIIPLPFVDDVRSNPDLNRVIRSPDALTDIMNKVVEQLQLPKAIYDPSRYPNPALQWHYRILQAMALEDDLPEKAEDKTIPRYRQIDKRAGDLVNEWGAKLDEEFRVWQKSNMVLSGAPASDRKRPASNGGEAAAAAAAGTEKNKKQKTSSGKDKLLDDAPAATDEEMQTHFNKNTISRLTVAMLKEWLGSKNMMFANTAKKADLVDQIEGYFENKR